MSEADLYESEACEALESVASLPELTAFKVKFLGKNGLLTSLMKKLGTLPPSERQLQGKKLNVLRAKIIKIMEEKRSLLEKAKLNEQIAKEAIDVTLPGRPEEVGRIHPIAQTMEDIIHIFGSMGFKVAEGPDIENDFHNFSALNIPPEHPSRQDHDTFYLSSPSEANYPSSSYMLRSHTSSVQIRTMMNNSLPLYILAPGRTYRADHDATHTPMFHQVEGLCIAPKINMAHLKGCLLQFLETFFAVDELPVRFRPSFFPFTEPSAEVDIGCRYDKKSLCIDGSSDSWLEVLGCGMIHPNVLRNCNINSEQYQGFAFGMGIERLAMLKYGIPDLRAFFDNDIRWLSHYGFSCLDIPSLLSHAYGQGIKT